MRPEHVCTDPSQPPIIPHPGQRTLYQHVLAAIANTERKESTTEGIVRLVSAEISPRLTTPADHWSEGLKAQNMRP